MLLYLILIKCFFQQLPVLLFPPQQPSSKSWTWHFTSSSFCAALPSISTIFLTLVFFVWYLSHPLNLHHFTLINYSTRSVVHSNHHHSLVLSVTPTNLISSHSDIFSSLPMPFYSLWSPSSPQQFLPAFLLFASCFFPLHNRSPVHGGAAVGYFSFLRKSPWPLSTKEVFMDSH